MISGITLADNNYADVLLATGNKLPWVVDLLGWLWAKVDKKELVGPCEKGKLVYGLTDIPWK